MKDKLFQIFFCVFIFWQPLLFSFLGESGSELDGNVMKLALIGVFLISWLFYFSYSPKNKDEMRMLFLLVLFGVAFYSTQYFYSGITAEALKNYRGQILRWGADCTSACVLGMTLLKIKNCNLIHKILPLVSIALTPFMLNAIISNAADEGQYTITGGLNYQLLAYYMAILFCISLYYSFVHQKKQMFIVKVAALLTMFIQAVACCMSGGRGGLVLLVVYVIYMSHFMLKRRILSKGRLISVVLACIVSFYIVANMFNMWSSSGFSRSSNLVYDDDRFLMWDVIWHYVTDNNYMPYGLGGDYFTFGFYTHNIILDWCIELGLIGACIMTIIYIKTYYRVFKLSKYNEIFIIIMILFLYGFVMNMFSGYWITTSPVWLAFGIAISSKNYQKPHKSIL